jgi:TPR repeat protein
MNSIGCVYDNEKKQYDKALAWFILAAMENNSYGQSNIGELYRDGHCVPQNYLCALKWFLKCIEQNDIDETATSIGELFEDGFGVPLDKYKALEWYCHGEDEANVKRLKRKGFHQSKKNKSKFNSIIDSLY